MLLEFCKQKTKLKENGNYHLFAANGKTETANYSLLKQRETKKEVFLFFVSKWQTVVDNGCFSKSAQLVVFTRQVLAPPNITKNLYSTNITTTVCTRLGSAC
jgi:hypothetical protein